MQVSLIVHEPSTHTFVLQVPDPLPDDFPSLSVVAESSLQEVHLEISACLRTDGERVVFE